MPLQPEVARLLTALQLQGVQVKTEELEGGNTRIEIPRDGLTKRQHKRIDEVVKNYDISRGSKI